MPVTAAFVASVTCAAPSGERPRDPRVDGAEAEVARRGPASKLVEEPLRPWSPTGSARRASLRRAARGTSPTVRRSCQPRPGPTGSPVARSHTIVDAALVGDADRVDRARGRRARRARASRHVVAIDAASNCTRPSAGRVGQQLAARLVRERAVVAHAPRRARCSCRRRRRASRLSASRSRPGSRRRTGSAGRACRG